MSFIEFLLWSVIIWAVYKFLSGVHKTHQELKKEIASDIIKQFDEIIHVVDIYEERGVQYWFDKQDGEFFGQGRTNEEVIEVLRQRYPTHMFFLPDQTKVHAPEWKIEPYDYTNHPI